MDLPIKRNPFKDVERPKIQQDEYETIVLTKEEGRKILNAPDTATLQGLRDRAIRRVVLLRVSCLRSGAIEIAGFV